MVGRDIESGKVRATRGLFGADWVRRPRRPTRRIGHQASCRCPRTGFSSNVYGASSRVRSAAGPYGLTLPLHRCTQVSESGLLPASEHVRPSPRHPQTPLALRSGSQVYLPV